jgi:tetratricopeptide (TPR) repeat protein
LLRPHAGGRVRVLLYFLVVRRLPVLLLLFVIAGCSGPPQKEIDQARSALDAARAAGAERYASAEYTAAASSLDKANAAVGQRDYRQALNYALDSRQRAVEAERQAADGRARAKAQTEALYGEVASNTNRLQTALRTAESAAPARLLRPGQASLREARAHLQKASAAITAGNFEEATKILTDVRRNVDAALHGVQNIPRTKDTRTTRRTRRG